MIEEILKNNNIKITKQRKLVLDIIINNSFTIKDIENKCNNKVDRTTIYRILDLFLDKNVVHKKVNINNEIYYEINNNKHIHYINCIKCHKKEEIDICPIEETTKELISNKHYKLISHYIELNGICSDCQK